VVDSGSFDVGRGAWLARLGTLRNVTRQELVTRQLHAHLRTDGERLRVLDVGAGQGTQSLRLAELGHDVVAADPDPRMLATLTAALAGRSTPPGPGKVQVAAGGLGGLPEDVTARPYDVVLCHGVLMYLPVAGPALRELAGLVAPGGVLSLVFRNADGIALRPALRRDWAEARALLDGMSQRDLLYRNEIGVLARADHLDDVEMELASYGLETEAWYGVRIATDGIDPDEQVPSDPAELEEMLDVEERLGRTDPYRRVSTLLHLLSRRPDGAATEPGA
jgi:S-adenosylmethionine-dependent methyltransferase